MTIQLTKEMGAAELAGVTQMAVGVSWDSSTQGKRGLLGFLNKEVGTDLDLIAVAMQGNDPVRLAGLDSLNPLNNGSLVHSGDNQTGKGSGDDETVNVTFASVPPNVTGIVFVIAAFKKYSGMDKARNVEFSVYDSTGGASEKVAQIWPSLISSGNACKVARAYRNGEIWELEVINKMGTITQGDEMSLLRFAAQQERF